MCLMDRNTLITELARFAESLRPTHYFTLTYATRRSLEARHNALKVWLDAIEWLQRRPLGWIRADEVRFSGLGMPEIPEHHHGLLIGTHHLDCRTAESLWRSFGDARVLRYEPHGGAAEYCMKHALHKGQDWDLGGKLLRGRSVTGFPVQSRTGGNRNGVR